VRTIRVWLVFLLALPLLAQEEERVRALISELAADEFEQRGAAEAELLALGNVDEQGVVDRLLSAACSSPDPEVSVRARRLVTSVRSWQRAIVFKTDVLRAVHLVTGATLWTYPTTGSYMRIPQTRERPGPVFLLGRPSEGLELRTGEFAWRSALDHLWNQAGPDGKWFLGGKDWISLCSPDTGEALWKASLELDPEQGWVSVDVDDQVAYVGLQRALFALDRATGRERWRREDLGGYSCLVLRGIPFVFRGSGLDRIDGATGREVWKWDIPEGEGYGLWPWSGDGEHAVFFSTRLDADVQRIHALDPATGRELWTRDGQFTDIWANPHGQEVWLVQALAFGHEVVALSQATGEELLRKPATFDRIDLCADERRVYVVEHGDSGSRLRVRAIDSATWKPCWTVDLQHAHTLREYEGVVLERRGPLLVLIHEAGSEAWVDRIDLDTGDVDRIFPPGDQVR